MPDQVLDNRTLNRATLDRQLLLRRADLDPLTAVEHLAGMQAQAPDAPYVGLWTRIEPFRHEDLARLLIDREVVRTHAMRVTVHLVSARDCLGYAAVFVPLMQRSFGSSPFRRELDGLDVGPVVEAARELLTERPMSRAELGPLLTQRWPGWDEASLAYAPNFHLPMVQVPPRGVWGQRGPAAFTPVQAWLDAELEPEPRVDDLLLRYLRAFGPASVADMRTWSGLTGLRDVVDGLDLRTYRDENGVVLYDLPDVSLPDPEAPAPPRFLPEYDNLLLSHADRARVISGRRRVPLPPGNGGRVGTLLVDGMWQATWRITRADGVATLTVEPFRELTADEQEAVADEGQRLLAFAAADAETTEVRFTAAQPRST